MNNSPTDFSVFRPLRGNMTSYSKPEVHNVLNRHQRRTETRRHVTCTESFVKFGRVVFETCPPFPQIDIVGAMAIAWRVRGKIIRSVLCNIVCNNCAQCNAHTYKQTQQFSGLLVFSLGLYFTVLRFIFVYVLCISLYIACMCNMVRWTWWD